MPPNKTPSKRRSSPPKEAKAPARGEKKTVRKATLAESEEDCVAFCIHEQQPTVEIKPEFTMNALGVNTTVLGNCLNTQCKIPPEKRFAGGEIKGGWSVGKVRSEAAKRGTC
jgi:hypothetical protein